MNDLRIILKDIQQLHSQTIKTKIKRFKLRKRKIRNITLFLDFQTTPAVRDFVARKFREIKWQAIYEMKIGKN